MPLQKVNFRVPAGACDTHFHVFGDPPQFAFAEGRKFTPPTATQAEHQHMLDSLGLSRGVLVQSTPYGTDHRQLMYHLRRNPHYRGVAVVTPDVKHDELEELHAAGVRGTRIVSADRGGIGVDGIERIARAVEPIGWHMQFYVSPDAIIELEPRLRALPVPIVFDHMAGLNAADVSSRRLDVVLGLLATGKVWVKCSGVRRASLEGPPYRDVAPLAKRFISAFPERVLWGTEWPHPNLHGATRPSDAELLNLVGEWAEDEKRLRAILTDNPARLYDFPI